MSEKWHFMSCDEAPSVRTNVNLWYEDRSVFGYNQFIILEEGRVTAEATTDKYIFWGKTINLPKNDSSVVNNRLHSHLLAERKDQNDWILYEK